MEIPLIKKFEAGYRAGVQAANPKVEVLVKYAGVTGTAFKDPTKGKELALAEYDAGRRHHLPRLGLDRAWACSRRRARRAELAIGVDADQYAEAPGFILTSMVKRVDTAVFDTIGTLKAGRWQGGVREFGLEEDGVGWVYDDEQPGADPRRR